MKIIQTQKLSIIAVISLGILLTACSDLRQSSNRDSLDSKYKISLEELVKNPNKYMEKTVTVKGKFAEWIVPSTRITAFTLEKNSGFGQDDKLLIIDRNAGLIRHSFMNNQTVKVIGEVDQFFLADFERAYRLPWATDARRRIVREFEAKPVIIASSMISIK